MVKSIINLRKKKLKSKNSVLPFTSVDNVLNVSSVKLTEKEFCILRYSFSHLTEL